MVRISGVKIVSFTDAAIKTAVRGAKRSVLAKGGYYVMQAARFLLRPARRKSEAELTGVERRAFAAWRRRWLRGGGSGAKPRRPFKPSAPGEPPRVRPASPLKRLLRFGWDSSSGTVVVGPIGFGKAKAPAVLEFGGTGERSTWDAAAKKRRAIKLNVKKRPFMGPALRKVAPALPAMWRNSIGTVRR
jgi:hypothetical protein